MTRHLFHAAGALAALAGLKVLALFNVVDWSAGAQQFVLVLGILCVGIPGALTYWDRYQLEKRKKYDEANRSLYETRAADAEKAREKAVADSLENQERMRVTLHEIRGDLQTANLRNIELNRQLIEATKQHTSASQHLRNADDRIVELTREIERLRIGVKDVQKDVGRVDKHVKQVAQAMSESVELPTVNIEMDSDGDMDQVDGTAKGTT